MKPKKFCLSCDELGGLCTVLREIQGRKTAGCIRRESGMPCFDPSSLLKNGPLKKKANLVSGEGSRIKSYLDVKEIKGFRTTEGKMYWSEQ